MNSKLPFQTIQDVQIRNRTVLVRVDFDVTLSDAHKIVDDVRIRANLPTLKHLLKNGNRLILIAKLGRPTSRSSEFSLQHIMQRLRSYLPNVTCKLVDDFLTEPASTFKDQKNNEVLVLENIRFYKEEKTCAPDFVKKLASLGDVYVNDAFSMAHRSEASIVGIPRLLPAYSGLQLAHEVSVILKTVHEAQKPLVTIIGGAKISTKINLIKTLLHKSDYVLLGGALANTFLIAHGYEVGLSHHEYEEIETARNLLHLAQGLPVRLMLPVDVIVGNGGSQSEGIPLPLLAKKQAIYDIGPHTAELYAEIIGTAQTVVWNGPMGMIEKKEFRSGTQAIYDALLANQKAFTLVGGGDTLSAIAHEHHLERIDHISTGGGAMLELIEKGTLPGIEALRKHTA